jgi:hypothetical protein
VPSSSVTFHFRASIQQRTGEDWKNVSLKLSTSQGELETAVPAMRQLKLQAKTGYRPEDGPVPSAVVDSFRRGKGFGNVLPSIFHRASNATHWNAL